MNIHIRKARPGEEQTVLDFYNDLIEGMKGAQYPIRWVRDVYPVLADIQKAVSEDSLYIAVISWQEWQEICSGNASAADRPSPAQPSQESASAPLTKSSLKTDRPSPAQSSQAPGSANEEPQSGLSAAAQETPPAKEKIIGAFILNHLQSEGYELVKWKVSAAPAKVTVLHLLATSPLCQGHGLGHRMLSEAVRICREEGDKAIRLDTLTWNKPGKTLYEHFGFTYCGDISLYYPTTGDLPFSMYEYNLAQ